MSTVARAVVIGAGGRLPPAQARRLIEGRFPIVAADGGARTCLDLGVMPSVVIGDLDSLDSASLERLTGDGVEIQRHPREKDQTDLELGLGLARDRGAEEILLLGFLGGRWDHSLANLLLPAGDAFSGIRIWGRERGVEIHWLRPGGRFELREEPGTTISLIPLGGPARGVRTAGLSFALAGQTLPWGTARGVSNRIDTRLAWISQEEGVLACLIDRHGDS